MLKPLYMFVDEWWYDVDFKVAVAILSLYKNRYHQKHKMWSTCKCVVCTALSLGTNSGCYSSILCLCLQRAGALPSLQVFHSRWQKKTKDQCQSNAAGQKSCTQKTGNLAPSHCLHHCWTLHQEGTGKNSEN